MSQAILEIIFKTVNNGQGGKQAAAEMKELKSTVGELTGGLTGLNLGSLTAAGAVVAIGGAVKQAADFAVQAVQSYQVYGEQIRTLNAITGTGAEQTSRLVQAFDDLGISQEQFSTLAQGAAKKGFVMTIDNVAALADKYNALSTQTEKNKLLTDTLGKSALATAKAFEAGGQAIKDAAAAQDAGMVITDKQLRQLELLRKQQDQLTDAQTSATNLLAQNLVPITLDFVSATEKLVSGETDLWKVFAVGLPVLASHEKTIREVNEAAIAAGESAGTWANDVGVKLVPALNAGTAAIDPMKKAMDDVNTSMKTYNTQLQFQIASEGLSAENKMKLADAMGLIDAKSRYAIVKTQEWKEQLDKGMISIEEYDRLVASLANSLQRIESKDVTIAIHYVQTGDPRGGQRWGGQTDDGNANGGTFTVPPGYPNDSYTVGMTSGETYTVVNDRIRATGSGSSGGSNGGMSIGSVTIQINGAGNPSAVADAVAFQLASLGKKFQGT